jgi:hypothetical protein
MFCADLKLDTEKLVNPGGNPGTPSALALGVSAVVSF